jgi:hypothetical protein
MSNETNKSSVEQFAIALYEGGYLQGNGDEINDLLQHHKAIHKEEIEDAHWYGGQDVPIHESTCEEYYKEKFGGNNMNF